MHKPLTYALLLAATLALAACGDKPEEKKMESATGSAQAPASIPQQADEAVEEAGATIQEKAAETTERAGEAASEVADDTARRLQEAGDAIEQKAEEAAKSLEEEKQ